MAGEEQAAPAAEARDEVDLARAAIYFLAILLVGLLVVYWVLGQQRDKYREAVDFGSRNLPSMAGQYDAVRGLLKQYKDSDAGEARNSTRTWLQQRYKNAGIPDTAVSTEKWNERAAKEYSEWYVDVVVKGQTRERLVHFLWNVERMSSKMRTIEMKLTRVAPANAAETDNWDLRASFGYRVPRGFKEGG
jgi:hypothetical protein